MQTKELTKQGIVATIYVTISLLLAPISYGMVQFRIAEAFLVLPFYDRKFTLGVTLGCLIVNMFSPIGIVDVLFGTTATLITCLLAARVKRMVFIAPLTAVLNGLIIGAELHFVLGLPFLLSLAGVAFGELVVVSIGSVAAKVLERYKVFKMLISSK